MAYSPYYSQVPQTQSPFSAASGGLSQITDTLNKFRQQNVVNEESKRRLAIDEEKAKRDAEVDRILKLAKEHELKTAQDKTTREAEARGKVQSLYQSDAADTQTANELQGILYPGEERTPVAAGPTAAGARAAGIPAMTGYSPEAKGLMDDLRAQEKAAQAQQEKVYGLVGAEEKRQQELRDWAEKNQITFQQQKALADIMAGHQVDVATKKAALNTTNGSVTPESKMQHATDVINKIDIIDKHPGFGGAVGFKNVSQLFGLKKEPVPGTEEAGFNAEYNALKSMLTLENLGKLKGVLSDKDMEILKSAATSLDPAMPEKDFKRELYRVKEAMSKVRDGVTPAQPAVGGASGAPTKIGRFSVTVE